MAVGDTLLIVYGLGGYDESLSDNNLVEQHVITAEKDGVATIEVRDGKGNVTSTREEEMMEPVPADPVTVLLDKLATATTLAEVRAAATDAKTAQDAKDGT